MTQKTGEHEIAAFTNTILPRRSVHNTLQSYHRSWVTSIVAFGDHALLMPTRHMHSMFQALNKSLYDNDFEKHNKRVYEEHNARVKALVPPERLLVYTPGDGWEPLCAFLGRPLPDNDAIVNVNKGDDFNKMTRQMWRTLLLAQLKRVLDVAAYTTLTATVVGAVLRRFPGLRRLVGY